MGFKAQLHYRVSLATQTLGTFLLVGLEYLTTVALLHRFGNLKGWTIAELSILFGVIQLGQRLADTLCYGVDRIGIEVRQGTFEKYLLRPAPVLLQLLSERITVRRVGAILQALIGFAVGFYQRPDLLGLGFILFLLYCSLCSAFLFLGLFLLRGAVNFRVWEGIEFMNILTYGGRDLSQYPAAIFPSWAQRIFTFVIPYYCVAYLPLRGMLADTGRVGMTELLLPLAGVAFFGMTVLVFNWAMDRRAL
jgi:ABC-2 type transport system permease protein